VIPARAVWGECVCRRAHHLILLDSRVREIQAETKRAVADADTREGRLEAKEIRDRLRPHSRRAEAIPKQLRGVADEIDFEWPAEHE
jgi:hypothetical protein